MIDWGLMAFSAPKGIYSALEKYVEVISEINEKVDTVTCWEYKQ